MPFPNVYEPRPVREAAPLSSADQKKLESELATLRESQRQRADPPPPAPAPAPPKQAVASPAKKAATADAPARKQAAPAKKQQDDAVVPEQKGPAAPFKLVN